MQFLFYNFFVFCFFIFLWKCLNSCSEKSIVQTLRQIECGEVRRIAYRKMLSSAGKEMRSIVYD
jgi:hypothetical protein